MVTDYELSDKNADCVVWIKVDRGKIRTLIVFPCSLFLPLVYNPFVYSNLLC